MPRRVLTIPLRLERIEDLFFSSSVSPLSPNYGPQGSTPGIEFVAGELYANQSYRSVDLTVMVPGPLPDPAAIKKGIVRYCDARLRDIEQDHRAIVWRGTRAFIAAAVALVAVIWLSKSVYEAGSLPREVLSEGLSIAGWVALWIPFELLSFQLWDHHLDKRTYQQLSELSLTVETTPVEHA